MDRNLADLINNQKVDSRLKGFNGMVTHPVLNVERTYCVVCGRPKGWVSVESYEFIKVNNIVVVCDECDALYGDPGLKVADIQELG